MKSASPARGSRQRSRTAWGLGSVLLALVLVGGAAIAFAVLSGNRPRPDFPSLTANPDARLKGTVAYVEPKSNCIRLVSLSGKSSKQLYCIPPWSVADSVKYGKPTSPQLVWLAGGKLEVTFFRMTKTPGSNVVKGWQFVIDVATGAVTNTPAEKVPSQPNVTTRPSVNARDEMVKFSSDSESGRVKVWVEFPNGTTNMLLDERGPGKYTYGMNTAFWGPDGETIFAEDGRILVMTPNMDPIIRILVDEGDFGLEADVAERSSFAVTTEGYLD